MSNSCAGQLESRVIKSRKMGSRRLQVGTSFGLAAKHFNIWPPATQNGQGGTSGSRETGNPKPSKWKVLKSATRCDSLRRLGDYGKFQDKWAASKERHFWHLQNLKCQPQPSEALDEGSTHSLAFARVGPGSSVEVRDLWVVPKNCYG